MNVVTEVIIEIAGKEATLTADLKLSTKMGLVEATFVHKENSNLTFVHAGQEYKAPITAGLEFAVLMYRAKEKGGQLVELDGTEGIQELVGKVEFAKSVINGKTYTIKEGK